MNFFRVWKTAYLWNKTQIYFKCSTKLSTGNLKKCNTFYYEHLQLTQLMKGLNSKLPKHKFIFVIIEISAYNVDKALI